MDTSALSVPDDQEVEAAELADAVARMVAGGDSVDAAVRRLGRRTPPEVIELARALYERRVGRIRDVDDPRVLLDPIRGLGNWYSGPISGDVFWPAVEEQLIRNGPGRDAIGPIDAASSRILGLLSSPGNPRIRSRGLVLGYVQSGKTTNFTSVIAKAADRGYRLFIILSGITDNLRSQTQERLDEVLVGGLANRWFQLTDLESDFASPKNATNLLLDTNQRLLAVVKKNPYRLRRLKRWLESAGRPALESCPILLIDDEADQASINVGRAGRETRINGLIKQILDNPKVGYLAYTATPFANLLINPEDSRDLYPRDFIVELDRADAYYGAEKIFGREALDPTEPEEVTDGLDVIRHVPTDEAKALLPPRGRDQVDSWQPEVTLSLGLALRWFLLATAARRIRGTGGRHSTMLVHTSMLSAAHFRMRDVIRRYLDNLADRLRAGDSSLANELKEQWQGEIERVPAEAFDLVPVEWSAVSAELVQVAAETRLVVDNYLSRERLSYARDKPAVTAIVIGGNTLSRGLTLEGLSCSFFVRAASAYDTLLQMGRWFGYRTGYADLARMWMTAELQSWFFDLATVEEEIRRQIRRYAQEQLTPAELPVKIRQHPAMAVTSAAKMQGAVKVRMNYSGAREQTILFEHRDADWLRGNIDATCRFLTRVRSDPDVDAAQNPVGRAVFRHVPADLIRGYLLDYAFHPRAVRLRAELLVAYLDEQTEQNHLQRWNIVVMGRSVKPGEGVDLGLARPIGLMERTRLDMGRPDYANIKTLVSAVDRVADLDSVVRQTATGRPLEDSDFLQLREDTVGDVGLLCIYPISKDSKPKIVSHKSAAAPPALRARAVRLPLDAAEHVVGLGLFFPEARGRAAGHEYVSADLSRIRPGQEPDPDIEPADDIDDIDAADEKAGEEAAAATSNG